MSSRPILSQARGLFCYEANNFFGWEAERVVAVTTGFYILEEASRAKTELILIFAKREREVFKDDYGCHADNRMDIKSAADEGLLVVEVIGSKKQIEETNEARNENESGCVHCCNVM